VKLYYKSYGTGPPIIFLHGLFGMGDNMRTAARLMEDQYQCILVDLRNHGRSPHDQEMNFDVMAGDIQELMDDLQLESAILLGHSLGGKVAMQYAIHHQGKVKKLIVVDIAPKSHPPNHDDVIGAIESIRPEQLESRADAEESFVLKLGNDQSTIQFLMKNLSRVPAGGFEWKANMPVIIASYAHLMADIDAGETFLKPALFVRGENSDYITDEDMTLIKELFVNSYLTTIPNAGHWVHADQPVHFTQQILEFLNEEPSF
jgi:pimeloyl-ACP methyl ester carboxylesterase